MIAFYLKNGILSSIIMKKLSTILAEQKQADGSLKLTFNQLQNLLQDQGMGIWIVLLALPSALPVPAFGYSTPFGLVLAYLSFRLVQGRTQFAVPKKWGNKMLTFPAKIMTQAIRFLKLMEHFIHPQRFAAANRFFKRPVVGINMLLLAIIMVLPIPLTNSAPALLILLFGLGLMEEDGLVLCLCQIASVILISGYIIVGLWIVTFGLESFQNFVRWLF